MERRSPKLLESRGHVYRTAVVFVCMLLLAGSAVVYSDMNRRRSERKFCDIMNTIVHAYETQPAPTTDLGRELKKNYVDLQERLGCK